MPLSGLQDAYNVAAYMRVTSLAIAGYDFLQTLPTVWCFYREHWQARRLNACAVLALLQVSSISVLIISNVGFFYSSFTEETCGRFYLLSPAFKVLQSMVTQAILGFRAFNLSRRSQLVGWFLLTLYMIASTIQWITTLIQRTPLIGKPHANCRGATHAKHLGAYIFYAIAIIYDVITTTLSVMYLLKYKFTTHNSMISKMTGMMLYDGLGYLVALTAVNILNLFLYKTSADIQVAGASLGYTVAWIMSQRLLLHLYAASRARRQEGLEAAVTVGNSITNTRDISQAVRSFDRKSNMPFNFRQPDSTEDGLCPTQDGGVQVRVERTVQMSRFSKTYELEDYSLRSQNR